MFDDGQGCIRDGCLSLCTSSSEAASTSMLVCNRSYSLSAANHSSAKRDCLIDTQQGRYNMQLSMKLTFLFSGSPSGPEGVFSLLVGHTIRSFASNGDLPEGMKSMGEYASCLALLSGVVLLFLGCRSSSRNPFLTLTVYDNNLPFLFSSLCSLSLLS